jgi:hypothetical protein
MRRLAVLVAVGLGLAVTGTATAAPSAAGHRICVALVVDAHSIGGPVSTGCAKVDRGATGVDVLEAAGHTVTFRSDGLLCTIDGLPRSGCSAVDDTHYWAYFHRAPGSTRWSYSDEGPSTYRPVNDSTEGWVYDDGTKLTPRNVRYASICPPEAPTPRPTPRTTPGGTPQARHHATARPRPPSSPAPVPTARHRNRQTHRARPHRGSGRARPAPAATATPTPGALTGAPVASHPAGGGGHGGLIGVVVAAVITAGLGTAAVISARRRS